MRAAQRTGRRTALVALTILLAACGGGGSGGGATGSAGGGGGGGGTPTALLYSGLETQAAITPTNASPFLELVLGFGDFGGVTRPMSVASGTGTDADAQQGGAAKSVAPRHRQGRGLLRQLRELGSAAFARSAFRASGSGDIRAAVAVDQTDNCTVSGTARSTGDINSDGTGTLRIVFDRCVDAAGGPSITGTLDNTRTRRGPSASILETELVYGAFSATIAGVTTQTGGRLVITEDADANRDTVSGTFRFRDSFSGVTSELRNFTVITRYDNYGVPQRIEDSYEGRAYISNLGYVNVRTDSPLVRSDPDLAYPDVGGVLALTGSGTSTALLEAASARTARVQVDAAGDGTFEIAATVAWDEIGGPSSLALTDGDGDGMHDSWERTNGLDPARAADAGEDGDGDGFTNRIEYAAGSTPNAVGSVPKGVAALATSLRAVTAATADVDDDAEYELRVTNAGPNAATTVRARLRTDGATPIGLTAGDAWTCVRDSTHTTCTLERIASGSTASLRFRVHTPVTAGNVRFSSTVGAETVDLERGDNTASLQQAVRTFTPVLEARLNRTATAFTVDPAGRRIFGFTENTPADPSGSNVFVVDTSMPTVARELGRHVTPSAVAAARDGESLYLATFDGFLQLAADDGRTLRLFGRLPGRTRDDRLTAFPPLTIPGRPDLLLVRVEGDVFDPEEHLVLYRDGTPLPDTIELSQLSVRAVAWDADRGRGLILRNVSNREVADLQAFTLGSTGVQAAGTLLRDVRAGDLAVDGRYAATAGGALIDLSTDSLLVNDETQSGAALFDGTRQRLYRFGREGRFNIYDLRDGRWLYSTRLGLNTARVARIDGNLFVVPGIGGFEFLRLPVDGF